MLKNEGFTLIEVIIALVILIVAILGTAVFITSSLRMLNESQENVEINAFISSVSSSISAAEASTLSPDQFSNLVYNNQPVIVTFSEVAAKPELIRITITLARKNGRQETYTTYTFDQ